MCSSSIQVQRTWTIRSRSDASVGRKPTIETSNLPQPVPVRIRFLTPQCASLAVIRNPGRSDRYHRSLHHMMYKLPSQYTCTACTHRLYTVIPHPNLHASTLYPQHRLAAITGHTHTTMAGLTCSRSLLEGAMSLQISTLLPHTYISTSKFSLTIPCHVSESTRLDRGKWGLVKASLRRWPVFRTTMLYCIGLTADKRDAGVASSEAWCNDGKREDRRYGESADTFC